MELEVQPMPLERMPFDLVPALGALVLCCGIAFAAGKSTGQRWVRYAPAMLLGLLGAASGFAWFGAGRLWWATVISSSAALIWSNATPILLTFAAGVLSHTATIRATARRALSMALVMVAMAAISLPVARSAMLPAHDLGKARWVDGVCLQSSSVSCAPAAAATLLMHHQVAYSERTLAEYCLTGANGTTPLGLYRGLTLAGGLVDMQPAILPRDPESLATSPHLPAVALVRFDVRQMGLEAGPLQTLMGQNHEGHAVVVYGRTPRGNWRIADPAVGHTIWTDETFRQVWTGEAIGMQRGARDAR